MKGHVGGGSGLPRLSGVVWSVKLSRSLWELLQDFGSVGFVYMSQYISTSLYVVQEWLLKMSGMRWPYSGWRVSDIKLESLILAQNERWRHA